MDATPKGVHVSGHRNIVLRSEAPPAGHAIGRNVVAVVGIDRYRHWTALANAVNDAQGVRTSLSRVGFQEPVPPLLEAEATAAELRALVLERLSILREDDSLILFYAGHGGSRTHSVDGKELQTGYLIPVDAEPDRPSTWIDLESWLRSVSMLPPRHILVILDACHSGIALDPIFKWRGTGGLRGSREALHARRSRRIITSALGDQLALDSGPRPGHSLFTGCLLDAIAGGVPGVVGSATCSELAVWVQQRVCEYPRSRQTPDFGTFFSDDRGEMIIPVHRDGASSEAPAPLLPLLPLSRPPPPSSPSVGPRPGEGPPPTKGLRHVIEQGGEWTMVAAPLLALGLAGLLGHSC
jgi:hypothetical protein